MKAFLEGHSASACWMRQRIPAPERITFFGFILFAVEGGLLKSRLVWPTGNALRHASEIEAQGQSCRDAMEIIGLVRADLPLLNEVRALVC
jgi:hypothetical protein